VFVVLPWGLIFCFCCFVFDRAKIEGDYGGWMKSDERCRKMQENASLVGGWKLVVGRRSFGEGEAGWKSAKGKECKMKK
jgi:hypothetical protein